MSKMVKELRVLAVTTDPVYIGTGGYTIGRVDNTIVRDPVTRIPKIPGSSLAGTWRYYTTLEIHQHFANDRYRTQKSARASLEKVEDIFASNEKYISGFEGNRYIGIKCAGKDDEPNMDHEEAKEKETGHCGHCIVCKGFGFSKAKKSWQGMIYFSDLHILFFPVFTRKGVKWTTTMRVLEQFGLVGKGENGENGETTDCVIMMDEDVNSGGIHDRNEGFLNLGWLYLPYCRKKVKISLEKLGEHFLSLRPEDIVIVPEKLFSQIVNSNLEVRTSVSIDPITGAAREGALFTSEAIPRGTVLGGSIRIFDKSCFDEKELPSADMLKSALEASGYFFETLGIGGMTTRGFGRIRLKLVEDDEKESYRDTGTSGEGEENHD